MWKVNLSDVMYMYTDYIYICL